VALRQEEFTRLCDDVDVDRDRMLVERCQAGDAGAFGSLYARYYERLLRFCLRRLHDRHEAEDAAQEAFARAWRALPKFAGERRFYPWLTVIAGNICTDTLRRRSRSTPTEDVELGTSLPVGVSGTPTTDEMLIAAVDGELVHKALDRLSVRHRQVLAMREGSGWTYQQIADHEGVEIGTIETLLWRARQALKREFNVLSESRGAFAGFMVGAGAAIRSGILRTAHRTASLPTGGGGGSVRNALAGVAVTSAAMAASFIAPHALDSSHTGPVLLPDPAAVSSQTVGPALTSVTPDAGSAGRGVVTPPTLAPGTTPGASGNSASGVPDTAGVSGTLAPIASAAPSGAIGILSGGSTSGLTDQGLPAQSLLPEGLLRGVASGVSGISGAVSSSPVSSLVPASVDAVTSTASGLISVLGLGIGSSGLGAMASGTTTTTIPPSTTTTTTTTVASIPSSLGSALTSTLKSVLGQG
jgi:RNA polymerase sigma-70 factor, ECF subfamily